jgi:hypothetical protein
MNPNKPTAIILTESSTVDSIKELLKHKELFDLCTNTEGFAYHFNQLANKAVHFDYMMSVGLIPKDYFTNGEYNEKTKRC